MLRVNFFPDFVAPPGGHDALSVCLYDLMGQLALLACRGNNSPTEWQDGNMKDASQCVAMLMSYCLQRIK